jgi:sulfite reductase beta subunit-like hemoprotein
MCTTCGCADAVEPAGVETVKAGSNQLRGTVAAELREDNNVPLDDIPDVVDGPLAEYARTRLEGEGFGDWCHRQGVNALAERFSMQAAGV